MANYCAKCGSSIVENQGDICELCMIGADPYAANEESYIPMQGKVRKVLIGNTPIKQQEYYENDVAGQSSATAVSDYNQGGDVINNTYTGPAKASVQPKVKTNISTPISSGISKNISVDVQKQSLILKWFRTLFTGVPFSINNCVTLFQVFPDYTGTTFNAQGNMCDQVIVYGKLNAGSVSENNDVEVYGIRDSSNNIVAKTIRNKATGTTVTPQGTLGALGVWIITLLAMALVAGICSSLGTSGVIGVIVLIIVILNLPVILKMITFILGIIFFTRRR